MIVKHFDGNAYAIPRRMPAAALALAAVSCWAPVLSAQTQPQTPEMQDVQMTVGKSYVVDYPADIARISTSNPDVVDAVAITKREVLLNAKSMGLSTVGIWSKSGER